MGEYEQHEAHPPSVKMKTLKLIVFIVGFLVLHQYSYAQPTVEIFWDQQYLRCEGCPRLPHGYKRIKGKIPLTIVKIAKIVRSKNNPLGTYTPFEAIGGEWIALDEKHNYIVKRGKRTKVRGGVHGVTIFQKD